MSSILEGEDGFAAKPRTHILARAIGRMEFLDPPAEKVVGVVQEVIAPGPVKDALSGRWLGHALHPLLTDLPIGMWVSAVTLDFVGGRESERAARRLIAVGLLASVPTVWSGWSEWGDSALGSDEVRRVGLVHAALNVAAASLFAGSLVARRRRRVGLGKLLGVAGAAKLAAGGWLGSHMAYAQAVGVDQTALDEGPAEWTPALPESELVDGRPARAEVGGVGVLMVRQGGELHALADRCCHRGGALHEGELGDGTITCPLHASTFRLSDGSVLSGPAAYPQPLYEVRSRDGMLEVRARGA